MSASASNIVITGVGLASPLGLTARETWQNVLQNRCGITLANAIDGPLPPGKDVGQCPDLPADFSPDLPRAQRYLRWAIQQAMTDAGVFEQLPCPPERATVMLGTTLHNMPAGGHFLRDGKFEHLRKFLAGDVLADAVGDWPLLGGRMTTCSACSSSLGSIALGITLLQQGAADLVIAGGYDPISEYAWAGFNSLRLVSDPPLRPFARGRVGMKVSESYAIVILERAADAQKRSAKPLCAIAGWGESADAHHLTQPHPAGDGALRAMQDAVHRAQIEPKQIQLIAAHATGTPDNDSSEAAAMARLLPGEGASVPVVGFKSHLGHTLGGAGAAELILSAFALRDQTVPPTANLDPAAVEFGNVHLQPAAAPKAIEHTLNTSLGFGGANTSVILRPVGSALADRSTAPTRHKVVITGIGMLMPGIIGKQQFIEHLKDGLPIAAGDVDESTYLHLLNARRVRRMSPYVKLTLAAVALACADAGLTDPTTFAGTTAGLLGTMHGSAGFCREYYGQIVTEGPLAANPLLFAEGVPNAAAAQLSLMLGLKQSCQTLLGTRTAGLDALRLASLRIAAGDWQRAIVSAGEEFDPTTNAAYEHCGLRKTATTDGFENAAGAVALIVESAEAAAAREATVLAMIIDSHTASGRREDLIDTTCRAIAPYAGESIAAAPETAKILNRIENAAMKRTAGSISHPIFPELFSASPLAALAERITLKLSGEPFVTLATDYSGVVTAIRCSTP